MKNLSCDKMIIAILQNDDYREVVEDLNNNGFYVTVLRSSGGFLKNPSATIMIGLNHEYLEEALTVLKKYGKRTVEYPSTTLGMAVPQVATGGVPVSYNCGGVTLFILDVDRNERY